MKQQKVFNKSGLPKGFHLKNNEKIELHLPYFGKYKYFGLFDTFEAANFIAQNHHLFDQYNVKRNGNKSGSNYWSVYDRFYATSEIKSAFTFGRNFTLKNNIKYHMSKTDFHSVLSRKNITLEMLSKRWSLSVDKLSRDVITDTIAPLYADAIKHIQKNIKNMSINIKMPEQDFSDRMKAKKLSHEYLSKAWDTSLDVIEKLEKMNEVPSIYVDAIHFLQFSNKIKTSIEDINTPLKHKKVQRKTLNVEKIFY